MKVLKQLGITVLIVIFLFIITPSSILLKFQLAWTGWYLALYGVVGLFIYNRNDDKPYRLAAYLEIMFGGILAFLLSLIGLLDLSYKDRSLLLIFFMLIFGVIYGRITYVIFQKYKKNK